MANQEFIEWATQESEYCLFEDPDAPFFDDGTPLLSRDDPCRQESPEGDDE